LIRGLEAFDLTPLIRGSLHRQLDPSTSIRQNKCGDRSGGFLAEDSFRAQKDRPERERIAHGNV
jgi:hypothetical protein